MNNYTMTITAREREVMLESLKFLSNLLSNAAVVDQKPEAQYNSKSSPDTQTVTARIFKAEDGSTKKGDPCVRVSWGKPPAHPSNKGGGIFHATCFDTALFPAIRAAVSSGQPVKLLVKKRGDYLNIVGVAA